MKLQDLTLNSIQAAIKTVAVEIRGREEATGYNDEEVSETAKQIVRMEYIKECAWQHVEKGLSMGEAIKEACEGWNAFVDEATA